MSETLDGENTAGNFIAVPEHITEQWVTEALAAGYAEYNGRLLFVRPYPTSAHERAWLTDTYGSSTPGETGRCYAYHGTRIELLPLILRQGLFGILEHPTLSGDTREPV